MFASRLKPQIPQESGERAEHRHDAAAGGGRLHRLQHARLRCHRDGAVRRALYAGAVSSRQLESVLI